MQGHLFGNQIGLTASLQGLDMSPARVLTEHLNIDQSNKQLLEPSLVHLGVLESRFEDLNFSAYQCILFRFRLTLSDGPDERVKLPTPSRPLLAHRRCDRIHDRQECCKQKLCALTFASL